MPHVTITIDGRAYRMACDEGQEEHLTGLGQMLDGKMEQLRTAFGEIGDMRLAVMAGIMIADELSEARRKVEETNRELEVQRDVRSRLTQAAEETQQRLAAQVVDAAARIEALAEALHRGRSQP